MTAYDPAQDVFADPRNSLGYLTRILFRTFSRTLELRTLPYGVSSGQWRFLRVLWQEDGLTQRELSRRVGMREPTTVMALRGLEKGGLVVRTPGVEDRRKVHVSLTDRARDLRGALAPCVAEVNAIATRGMSAEEVATLRRLLLLASQNLAETELSEAATEA